MLPVPISIMRTLAIKFEEEDIELADAYCRDYPRNNNGLTIPRAAVIRMFFRLGAKAAARQQERILAVQAEAEAE